MRGKIPWEKERRGVYTLREWEIDPARSALLILDMQCGYVESNRGIGPVLKQRYPEIHDYYYGRIARVVLPNILKLRDFCREHRLQVIYTRMGLQLPEGKDLPDWSWRKALLSHYGETESPLFYRESPEYGITGELKPLPGELVLDKNTMSPLNSTALDQILRNMGIENVIVTGVLTSAAVEITARSIGDRGYNVIVVEDGCAAYSQADQENSLRSANNFVVKTADEVVDILTPLLRPA